MKQIDNVTQLSIKKRSRRTLLHTTKHAWYRGKVERGDIFCTDFITCTKLEKIEGLRTTLRDVRKIGVTFNLDFLLPPPDVRTARTSSNEEARLARLNNFLRVQIYRVICWEQKNQIIFGNNVNVLLLLSSGFLPFTIYYRKKEALRVKTMFGSLLESSTRVEDSYFREKSHHAL